MSFKALLEKLSLLRQNREKREGKCYLSTKHYASLDAVETFNGKINKRQVHWICELYPNGYAFILLDGVTGQESWYVNDLVKTLSQSQETDCQFLTACLGCSNYPELKLYLTPMKLVIRQLNSQLK